MGWTCRYAVWSAYGGAMEMTILEVPDKEPFEWRVRMGRCQERGPARSMPEAMKSAMAMADSISRREGLPLPSALPVESLPVGSDPGLREGHL